jgi:hypothetical protein
MSENQFDLDMSDTKQVLEKFGWVGLVTVLALIFAIPCVLAYIIGPMIGLGFWPTLGLLILLRFWFN